MPRVANFTMHKMQSIYVLFYVTKVTDFWRKDADVSRNQEVCKVIYIFFGSFLGKV